MSDTQPVCFIKAQTFISAAELNAEDRLGDADTKGSHQLPSSIIQPKNPEISGYQHDFHTHALGKTHTHKNTHSLSFVQMNPSQMSHPVSSLQIQSSYISAY